MSHTKFPHLTHPSLVQFGERGKMERKISPDIFALIKQDDDDEITFKVASAHSPVFQSPEATTISDTPCSAYIPSDYLPLTEVEEQNPRHLLNALIGESVTECRRVLRSSVNRTIFLPCFNVHGKIPYYSKKEKQLS